MTISGTITQNIAFPLVGEAVVISVSGTPNTRRVRWKVSTAPQQSTVDLDTWLKPAPSNGCQFIPDMHGMYELLAVEETYQSHIPHFESDPTNALEEWIETDSQTYSVYCGVRMSRTIGHGEHTATLEVTAHKGTFDGILTRIAREDSRVSITSPSSETARNAIATQKVQDTLSLFGASGYEGVQSTLNRTRVVKSSVALLGSLETAFNNHCERVGSGVHSDVFAHLMSSVATPTTLAGLLDYTSILRQHYTNHLSSPYHPHGPDTTHGLTSSVPSSLDEAVQLLDEMAYKLNMHRGLHTTSGHYSHGDGTAESESPVKQLFATSLCTSTAVCLRLACQFAKALGDTFDAHTQLAYLPMTSGYHASADADNTLTYYGVLDSSSAGICKRANTFADKLVAHATNINSTTGEAGAYHSRVDVGCAVDFRATDTPSAIKLIEFLAYMFWHHVSSPNGSWHGSTNPGSVPVHTDCCTRIQVAVLQYIMGESSEVPSNSISTVEYLTANGDFKP